MHLGAQNRKTGPDAIGTAQNGSESAKHENGNRRRRYRKNWVRERKTRKRDSTPSVSPKMCPGAQNIKSGSDALVIAENESGSAKHENETRRPRYRRNRVLERKTLKRDPTSSVQSRTGPGAQNMITGPDAVGIAENGSGSAKHENGTRHSRYRRKRGRERKT
jgi:hypothetical protein